jgi:hypothetical protein
MPLLLIGVFGMKCTKFRDRVFIHCFEEFNKGLTVPENAYIPAVVTKRCNIPYA